MLCLYNIVSAIFPRTPRAFFIPLVVFSSRQKKWARTDDKDNIGGFLPNETGPVPLVLDLRISPDRYGSSSDPSLNGHLRYPNDID